MYSRYVRLPIDVWHETVRIMPIIIYGHRKYASLCILILRSTCNIQGLGEDHEVAATSKYTMVQVTPLLCRNTRLARLGNRQHRHYTEKTILAVAKNPKEPTKSCDRSLVVDGSAQKSIFEQGKSMKIPYMIYCISIQEYQQCVHFNYQFEVRPPDLTSLSTF